MPMRRVDTDVSRFRRIVRGQIRKNLRRYVSQGELKTLQGGRVVSVPLPEIHLPKFTFGDRGGSGVGQGEGEAGEAVGGEPGEEPGEHELEAEVTLEERGSFYNRRSAKLPRLGDDGGRGALDMTRAMREALDTG